jgi:uncharacterized protein
MSNTQQFNNRKYLNLETYRKSGQAMPTPVWFVEDGGAYFIRTVQNAGKVKRVRNNPEVRIVPCGQRGEVQGEWVGATASIASAAEAARADQLLTRKYGLLKRIFDLMQRNRGADVIKVVVNP